MHRRFILLPQNQNRRFNWGLIKIVYSLIRESTPQCLQAIESLERRRGGKKVSRGKRGQTKARGKSWGKDMGRSFPEESSRRKGRLWNIGKEEGSGRLEVYWQFRHQEKATVGNRSL